MTDYRVTWESDITADSPREAAEKARADQVRPGTMAVVFDVADPGGVVTRVDLQGMAGGDYILWPGAAETPNPGQLS